MLPFVPASELTWLVIAVILAGVVTGVLAGLFGIGGGAIIVPVLYEVFRVAGVPEEVRMQLCVGTSLAIIAPTTIRSYLTHRAKCTFDVDIVRRWAVPAIVGVAIGALVAALEPSRVFKLAFVLLASLIATKLLFGRETWRLRDDLPGPVGMAGYGLIIGFCSSLVGVSGGALANLIVTLHGRSIRDAVAISAGIGVPITIAGTIGYAFAGLPKEALLPPLSLGFVSLPGLAVIAPISTCMAVYGARLAHVLPKRRLEVAFGLFLLVAVARFLVSLLR